MADHTVEPNPASPYATADLACRHLIPCLFGVPAAPCRLVLTACERMAVVPEETVDITDALLAGDPAALPAGLCPTCVGVATGRGVAERLAPQPCRECGMTGSQGEWCALCRQDLHEKWWPTREREAVQP